jgi:hypothetical protein
VICSEAGILQVAQWKSQFALLHLYMDEVQLRFGITCNVEDPGLQLRVTNVVYRELLLIDFFSGFIFGNIPLTGLLYLPLRLFGTIS